MSRLLYCGNARHIAKVLRANPLPKAARHFSVTTTHSRGVDWKSTPPRDKKRKPERQKSNEPLQETPNLEKYSPFEKKGAKPFMSAKEYQYLQGPGLIHGDFVRIDLHKSDPVSDTVLSYGRLMPLHATKMGSINTNSPPKAFSNPGTGPPRNPYTGLPIVTRAHLSEANLNKSGYAIRQDDHHRDRHRDKIRPPCLESGGVPEPTFEYLKSSKMPPLQNPQPRKILVVIDLNGTVLHRPSFRNPIAFIERPYGREFLSYCINTFKVVIWSSAQPANVQKMCNQLLTRSDRQNVVSIWGRDRFGLTAEDFVSRVMCYKRLDLLWDDPIIAGQHPEATFGKNWSQEDTVLVDDSIEKGRSHPYNLICLPEFVRDPQEPGCVLPQVHDYINACARYTNVSAYMRNNPFRVNPDFKLEGTSSQQI